VFCCRENTSQSGPTELARRYLRTTIFSYISNTGINASDSRSSSNITATKFSNPANPLPPSPSSSPPRYFPSAFRSRKNVFVARNSSSLDESRK